VDRRYVRGMQIRPAGADDAAALTEALIAAANWDVRARFTPEQVMSEPALAHSVSGWPRPGDCGAVAITDQSPQDSDGSAIGAAWCRTFDETDAGYGFVAGDVPEFSIGVSVRWRGQGVGSALLSAVVQQARHRKVRAISLSVEDGNRARALYERAGFVPVGRNGGSDTLVLELHS
jgi:ribosomal protein S18 acetylase RimI-like enzyme